MSNCLAHIFAENLFESTHRPAVCRGTAIVRQVEETVIGVSLAKYVNWFGDIPHDIPQI